MPKHTDKEMMKATVSDTNPKSKGGKLRKMSDKEKEVFAKVSADMDKSQKAKLRMKVMRSSADVDTPAKMKKLM